MSFALDTTEEVGGGESTYLSEPGTYHCLVTDVREGQGPKGNSIDGFTATLAVLAGTVNGQKDKQTNLCLFSPDVSKSESSQKWAKRKQQAFAIATGLVDPNKLGQKVNIELSDAIGRQVVVAFEKEADSKFLNLAYDNIYHVDDPRAAKFPKDSEAIGLVESALRKDEKYFAPLTKKPEGVKTESKLTKNELADL